MVYVGSQTSVPAVQGRHLFREAAERLAREHPGLGVRFFVVDYLDPREVRAWGQSFRDDRVAGLGYAKCGWVLWLESGQLREAEYGTYHLMLGVEGPPTVEQTVERTLSLWPR
jgi:hypothetical protein